MKTLVWGAGREGRGFLADVFAPVSDVVLVDVDRGLVDELRRRGRYRLLLRPVGAPAGERVVSGFGVAEARAAETRELIVRADVIALCVYLEDMRAAVRDMASGLEERSRRNPDAPLDIFICANSIHYAPRLRAIFDEELPADLRGWFGQRVGLVETLVRRTCVSPPEKDSGGDALAVMTNEYPFLTVDAGALKRDYADMSFIEPTGDMRMEERRKIYTYNLLHAAYAYLGRPKGYGFINESRDDPAIQAVAAGAYREAAGALTAEYGLDAGEMERYEETMWRYVVNPAMPDRVARTGCDPVRKLSREERIIGPALMCRRHGMGTDCLAVVAAHAFLYDEPSDPAARELLRQVREAGVEECIVRYCGLGRGDELVAEIAAAYRRIAGAAAG